ncbi:unnamed protein product [Meganyctiphanes norvegica]|uniref:N-acetyltransferase domain-containing protein n=1 Tax=Meganyctiphanes norvegica TaxID=48144 RepID=A0AAV2RFT8_MEGNR
MRAVNNEEELRKILKQQQNYLPLSSTIYGIICNELDYGVCGHLKSTIYVPDPILDGGRSSSLVVVYAAYDDVPNEGWVPLAIFWDSDAEKDSDIADLLLTIPDIDWNLPISVLPAPLTIIEKLKSILECGQFFGMKRDLAYLMDGQVYGLQAAQKVSIPDGYKLRALHPRDLKYIKSKTGPTHEQDRDVCTQLTVLPSAALYTDDNQGSEVLVSWATVRFNGEIGRIFTVPEYRGRGLAKVVTATLANHMLESREAVYVSIDASNAASIKFNTAIGFQNKYTAGIATIVPSS